MKKIFSVLLIIFEIFLPFVLSYLCQRLVMGRGYEFKTVNPYVLIINFVLWSAVFAFFLGIFKKNYHALFFYILFFIVFSIANRYKLKILNSPLKINDFTLGKQLFNFFPLIIKNPNLKKELIASFGFLFISFFTLKHFFKFEIKKIIIRIALIFVSLIILLLPYLNSHFFDQILTKTNIVFDTWNDRENCRVDGVLFSFIYDEKYLNFDQPTDYSQTKINQIYSNLPSLRETSRNSETEGLKPNVIVIMSESFWDATQFSGIKYSDDPIKNIRPDIKSGFVSPTFGGETANVEFELLTGLSNYFLPINSYPYTQYIKKTMPSLFTLFKDQGYSTTAIHPYSSSFYNRANVYNNLGVDKFTNLDNSSGYTNAGPFVSSKSFIEKIIEQFNSNQQSQLIWALSIQNHTPFEANRFSTHPITFQSSLNSIEKDTLQSYVDGINLVDQTYLFLKQELSKSNKPTTVFFFGDHLPFLGADFDIYKTNFEVTDETKMHTTPLVVWSNYKNNINLPKSISPSFLSLEVLKSANIIPKYQFAYLNSLISSGTVLNQKLTNQFTPEQLKNYELIQYDLIFGKQYGLK